MQRIKYNWVSPLNTVSNRISCHFSQYDSEENKDAIMWGAFLKWWSLEKEKKR